LSFHHVAALNPASADLLDHMAFLDASEMDHEVSTLGVERQIRWDLDGELESFVKWDLFWVLFEALRNLDTVAS
jgi:hypothetical protein